MGIAAAAAHPVIAHRLVAGAVIGLSALAALPVSAAFLDDIHPAPDHLVLGVALAAPPLIGAATGALLPGLAGASASRLRGGVVGAIAGAAAMVAADALWFKVIAG